jgi:F-type H+-transporting ATPase subunit b
MIPLLLAAATPAAHASDGEENLLQQFGIEPTFLIMQVISFGILAYILYRFMIKPILVTVDERNRQIESGLKNAEETQVRLAAAAQESAALIKTAQQEAQKVVDEARKMAKEFADKQNTEATARAADTLVKAQQAIELEHKKMLNEARGEIARLVVKTTEQVLAKKLTDADRAAYNEAATKELTSA